MDPHTRSERARSFDSVADLYDRVRPSYPQAAIAKMAELCEISDQSKILEIGAGSGKATELLMPYGSDITCVEPGPALARIITERFAGSGRVQVAITPFESFNATPQSFDCIVAAQAFHWLNPEDRLQWCHQLLRSEGSLALLWNLSPLSDSAFAQELYRIYDSVANGIREPSFSNVSPESAVATPGEELKNSPLFHNVQAHRFPWTAHYSGEEFMALLDTYSNHRALDADIRTQLTAAVKDLCARFEDKITKQYVSVLYVGQKR